MTESPATTLVTYIGVVGRKKPVDGRVIHPPRAGDHIRLMTWSPKKLDFQLSYYEVTHVVWDVRVGYGYRYVPGDEGEVFARAEAADYREKQRRRRRRVAGRRPRSISSGVT